MTARRLSVIVGLIAISFIPKVVIELLPAEEEWIS